MEKTSLLGNKDESILKREKENGCITYSTLADYVGNLVLCNNMNDRLYNTLDLESGETEEYFNEDGDEISKEEYERLENDGKECSCEPIEIYQYYIIGYSGANFLKQFTDEIVFYDNELDIYVWGITHCGTSWDYVFTDIPVKK